jgi:hypothetical protein
MPVLAIVALIFALVLLVLVMANVLVSQKTLNILFLVMVILICLNSWPITNLFK